MQGAFDDLIPAQKKPAQRGYIPGRPDPYKDEDQQFDRNAEARAAQDQRSQQAMDALKIENENLKLKENQARFEATGGVEGKESENKAAALVTNLQAAMNNIRAVAAKDPGAEQPGLLEIGAGVFGQDAKEWAMNDKRRDIAGSQFIAVDSALTLATGAAYTPVQIEGYTRSLFPTLNDSPYNIAAKRRKFEQIIQAGRLQAGAKAPNIDAAIAAVDAIYGPQGGGNPEEPDLGIFVDPAKLTPDGTRSPDMTGGVPTGSDIRFGFEGAPDDVSADFEGDWLASRGLDRNKQAAIEAFWSENLGNQGLTVGGVKQWYARMGIPAPVDSALAASVAEARKSRPDRPVGEMQGLSRDRAAYEAMIAREKDALEKAGLGEAGLSDLAEQGVTVGLSDEASGVGNALSSILKGENPIEGYQVGRDVERMRLKEAREREGALGTVVELAGGAASLGPQGVLNVAATPRQLVNQGALTGALTGYGYGEGLQGSLASAAVGATTGAALTSAIVKGADIVASKIGARPGNQAALETATAAADEGIPIPRAMVDPKKAVRATALDSTIAGRPVIEKGMAKVADDVAERVDSISAGTVLEAENVGNTVRTAAEREIANSGRRARKAYDNAESLAGDVKVAPKMALTEVDNAIARLSETSNTNSAEIAYLQGLKQDLSKDLSVGALRDLRTTLRQKISKGDLTFGQNEARVLGVMEAAANDIRSGLTAQGNAAAARAFDAADKDYSARMEFIGGTLQKLVGRRQDNFSGEVVAKKLAAMRGKGGDSDGLRKFFNTLSPDEKADIGATIADSLGKNRKGEFSMAILANNIEAMPRAARVTVFGEQGAKSLANLKIIALAFDKVKRNTSNTGIGNDWRTVLGSAVFGGGVPLATGSGGGTAMAAAVAAGGVKMGRDYISARLAMSPKFQRWLEKAIRARNPQQISNSFKGLRRIASTEPAISGDVNALSNYLLQAANDTGPMAAAADSGRSKPSEPNQIPTTAEVAK